MYDLAIIIGRFQPFHLGHRALFDHAQTIAKSTCLIIGSHQGQGSIDNPWTTCQRIRIIQSSVGTSWTALGINDSDYDVAAWARQVQENISTTFPLTQRIVVVGHEKDDSSFYLKLFPSWELSLLPSLAQGLSAREVRHAMYNRDLALLKAQVGSGAFNIIQDWMRTAPGKKLCQEYKDISTWLENKQSMVALHLVIFCNGKILLIQRTEAPDAQHYALPGLSATQDHGSSPGEKLQLLALTVAFQIGLEEGKLNSPLWEGPWSFNADKRDPRGRIPALVWYIDLSSPDKRKMPKLLGKNLRWFKLSEAAKFEEQKIALDHGRIMRHLARKKDLIP